MEKRTRGGSTLASYLHPRPGDLRGSVEQAPREHGAEAEGVARAGVQRPPLVQVPDVYEPRAPREQDVDDLHRKVAPTLLPTGYL